MARQNKPRIRRLNGQTVSFAFRGIARPRRRHRSRQKQKVIRQLKNGYIAMANINRRLAQEAIAADEQQFFTYEQILSESE